jgi:hypothetical protein
VIFIVDVRDVRCASATSRVGLSSYKASSAIELLCASSRMSKEDRINRQRQVEPTGGMVAMSQFALAFAIFRHRLKHAFAF